MPAGRQTPARRGESPRERRPLPTADMRLPTRPNVHPSVLDIVVPTRPSEAPQDPERPLEIAAGRRPPGRPRRRLPGHREDPPCRPSHQPPPARGVADDRSVGDAQDNALMGSINDLNEAQCIRTTVLSTRRRKTYHRRRVRHRRMSRPVHQLQAPQHPRQPSTSRQRAGLLRCPRPRVTPRTGTAKNLGRFTGPPPGAVAVRSGASGQALRERSGPVPSDRRVTHGSGARRPPVTRRIRFPEPEADHDERAADATRSVAHSRSSGFV